MSTFETGSLLAIEAIVARMLAREARLRGSEQQSFLEFELNATTAALGAVKTAEPEQFGEMSDKAQQTASRIFAVASHLARS